MNLKDLLNIHLGGRSVFILRSMLLNSHLSSVRHIFTCKHKHLTTITEDSTIGQSVFNEPSAA